MNKLGFAALLASLIILSSVISGCLSPEEVKKEKPLELELVGRSHQIYAGDTTTYIILINNNRHENDTFTLNIVSKPSDWDVTLNQTKLNLTGKLWGGVFLVVNSSQNAKKGDHKVKIEAVSALDGYKNSLSVTTKVVANEGERVNIGDKVAVDYLGYLANFTVFDTSIEEVAKNYAIQKDPTFQIHPTYEPFKVYVGPIDQDPTDEYVSSVVGFWEAIEGMRPGQSRTVTIPASKAYGEFANATLNVTEKVPMLEIMTVDEFKSHYPYDDAFEGLILKHHFWGWNVSVDYVDHLEDVVRMINEPYLNQTVNPFGWDSEVIYKNQSDDGGDGRILVRHYAQAGMTANYFGYDAEVISVEDNQIKLKYNQSTHPLGNEDLIFDITLIEIPD